MGFLRSVGAATALSLSLGQSLAAGGLESRQDVVSAKSCDATQKNVCFSEFSTAVSGTVFRIAIPEVSKAPFDTLVEVVARPLSAGPA